MNATQAEKVSGQVANPKAVLVPPQPTGSGTTSVPQGELSPAATGPDVVWLQHRLRALNFSISLDGRYGENVAKRVKAFQQRYGEHAGIQPTGVADTATLELLDSVLWPGIREPTRVAALQKRLTGRGYATTADGVYGPQTDAAVRAYQLDNGLPETGVVDPTTSAEIFGNGVSAAGATQLLTPSKQRRYVVVGPHAYNRARIIATTADSESHNDYSAVNWKDIGRDGTAGLSYGRFQFNQRYGALGRLFAAMYAADPTLFVKCTYGDSAVNKDPDGLAQRLINQLQSKNTQTRMGIKAQRNADGKLVEVDNPQLLTSQIKRRNLWGKRFDALASQPEFQQVQDDLAASEYLQPAQDVAKKYGFQSERAQALFFDIAVQHGKAGLRSFVREAVKKYPYQHNAMLHASDADRPTREHDMLVQVARLTELAAPSIYESSLIDRRRSILRSPNLSDAPLLPAPTFAGESPTADSAAAAENTSG